jgi:hypothetical protein
MPDHQQNKEALDRFEKIRRQFPLLVDTSAAGQERIQIARLAYEKHYQRATKWQDLNPETANHILQITIAVIAAINEIEG